MNGGFRPGSLRPCENLLHQPGANALKTKEENAMFNKIKLAALSAVVGLGALAAVPATAQADSFYFGISPAGPSFGFQAGPRHGAPGWDRGGHRPGRGWDRQSCDAGDALRKADRMGINRTYVRGQNRNTIRIGGTNRGRPVTVVFAKAPNCPIIR
jgi:hypothetical protein